MEKYKSRSSGVIVTATRSSGKGGVRWMVTYPDGNKIMYTEHKFLKKFEPCSVEPEK